MWESFNQLPIWLKSIVIIAPAGVLIGIAAALFIKILKSEKIAIGKEGLKLEDIEDEKKV